MQSGQTDATCVLLPITSRLNWRISLRREPDLYILLTISLHLTLMMTSAQVVEMSVTTTDKDYTITCYPRIQTIHVNLKVYINSFSVFTSFFAVFSRVSRLTQTKVTLICQSTQACCIIVANVHPALVLVKKKKKTLENCHLIAN